MVTRPLPFVPIFPRRTGTFGIARAAWLTATVTFIGVVSTASAVSPSVSGVAPDGTSRNAFLRSELLTARVTLSATAISGAADRVVLTLTDAAGATVFRKEHRLPKGSSDGTISLEIPIPLSPFKTGPYRLAVHVPPNEPMASRIIWVCPPARTNGFVLAILAEVPKPDAELDRLLDSLLRMNLTGIMYYVLTSNAMDRCLARGLTAMRIHLEHAAGYQPSPGSSRTRLNARGEPFLGPYNSAPVDGIADLDWQQAVANHLGSVVREFCRHPAFDPRLCTSDDWFRFTGLDYNPWNVKRFKETTGREPPRPPEALKHDHPPSVDRPKGIIPDDDPWVAWLRFCSQDVLGHYNRRATRAVLDASNRRGRIGPVSGGGPDALGIQPYADLYSGQWPLYNFGTAGYNLLCSYNYNYYWFPALAQLGWQEMGRMGNRTLPQWVMPDTMDKRLSYHLNNWWIFMASGVDGMVYFIQEKNTPAAETMLARAGAFVSPRRELLEALRPAARTVGLLMPFENACFRTDYPSHAIYALCNLIMAGADVEPVLPEELPNDRPDCRVVLLHDVDWLTVSNRDALIAFIHRGGVVACDSLTEVEIPGSVRLDFPLGDPGRQEGYGRLDRIAAIRNWLEPLAPAWARSENPHMIQRRFEYGGIPYLWLVHVMNREEDLAHVPTAGQDRDRDMLPEYADFDSRSNIFEIAVPDLGWTVFDVGRSSPVPSRREKGRLILSPEIPMWQGVLLAFYSVVPNRLDVRAPQQASTGRSISVDIRASTANRDLPHDVPLAMEVVQPDGSISREYSHTTIARRGRHRFTLTLAVNDMPGEWIVRARETTTGLTGETTFRLVTR